MKVNKYPDGTSYVEIAKKESIIFKINTYEDLWHLNQYVDAYWNYFRDKPLITIPNIIDGQADRRFYAEHSSGLKLVCKFLNQMSANFRIFHPHNAEVVEALMDNVEIIDNSEFIIRVLNQIGSNPILHEKYHIKGQPNNYDNLILMSSDAGGFKPLMKLCDKIKWQGTTESASKSRKDGKVDEQKVPLEDFGGKDILIVDDICIYGGTFKGLSKLLRERNCGKLYLAVSHITIRDHEKDNVFSYFDKVFTTNSKYDNYYVPNRDGGVQPQNLEIIKLF